MFVFVHPGHRTCDKKNVCASPVGLAHTFDLAQVSLTAFLPWRFELLSALETREGAAAGVDGVIRQLVLDTQQLVVLVDALATSGSTRLDLT